MVEEVEQTISYPERRRSTTVEGIANTLELVVTALILAFVFRSFVAEAFRIPTGSMAETLSGSHYHMRCVRCGYGYNMGGDSYSYTPAQPLCPSCGYTPAGVGVSISNGDRILVLKCIYQFFEPKRWDVIVFKNPGDPRENYIKRLIAKPGETVEIIDGDVYIDGQIARKPPKVQEEMWMCVYDNDYQMLGDRRILPSDVEGSAGDRWRQPFVNEPMSNWNLNANGPTVFGLDSEAGDIHTLYYDSEVGNDFRAAYAYNDGEDRDRRPICSDLMVRFDVTLAGAEDRVGVGLTKYGVRYEGSVDGAGRMLIEKITDGVRHEVTSRVIDSVEPGKHGAFRFSNVDRQLVLEYGERKLRYYVNEGPLKASERRELGAPEVRLFGAGEMTLWHVGVFRDTHYMGDRVLRGGEGRRFTLGADEFFACGDNSPESFDSRLWADEGIGNDGHTYTAGVVPRDYMMGKAFFVYWSDAFKFREQAVPFIPNMGGMKVIHGGSDEEF